MSGGGGTGLGVADVIQEWLSSQLSGDCVSSAWTIGKSKIGGRGLFATRDIQPSELILVDIPVILGPRRSGGPLCVGCHLGEGEGGPPLMGCPGGCRLPVCSEKCASSSRHQAECQLLSPDKSQTDSCKSQTDSSDTTAWSMELFHALCALRSLTLNDQQRNVVKTLQANNVSGQKCWEVESLRQELGTRLTREQEEWIVQSCRVMDTNAFETVQVPPEGEEKCGRSRGSLRGLYPLGALMNHSCSPNTTHSYDRQCRMQLMAATPIKEGDELSTSYVSQLWDTASRRHMLAKTKQFACRCDRCKDPSEFGSILSGLPCPEDDCQGLLLSQRPLDYRSPDWSCTQCSRLQTPNKVVELQRKQGMYLASIDTSDPDHVINFLSEGRVPDSGIVAVQLKAGLNLFLGHVDGYKLHELSDEHLNVKEKICRDLLSVMDKLKIGNTRLKGLNVFDLHLTLSEKMRRIKLEEVNEDDSIDSMQLEIMKTWELAKKILSNDATAPLEFHDKLKSSRVEEISEN